jgi:hypothetical protein
MTHQEMIIISRMRHLPNLDTSWANFSPGDLRQYPWVVCNAHQNGLYQKIFKFWLTGKVQNSLKQTWSIARCADSIPAYCTAKLCHFPLSLSLSARDGGRSTLRPKYGFLMFEQSYRKDRESSVTNLAKAWKNPTITLIKMPILYEIRRKLLISE